MIIPSTQTARPDLLASLLLLCSIHCSPPDFDGGSGGSCGGADNDSTAPLEVTIEPAAAHDNVPIAMWARIKTLDDSLIDPSAFVLVQGGVTSSQLGQLEREDISQTLTERLIDHLSWAVTPGEIVLAPIALLNPDAQYTVASGSPKLSLALQTQQQAQSTILEHVWPPDGTYNKKLQAVWCAATTDVDLGDEAFDDVAFNPLGALIPLQHGADPTGAGSHCLHARLDDAKGSFVSAPNVSQNGATTAAIAPVLFHEGEVGSASDPVSCTAPAYAIGPACLEVFDDRALLHPPVEPYLWTMTDTSPGGSLDEALVTGDAIDAWIAPLTPSTTTTLTFGITDAKGEHTNLNINVTTLPPSAHVIINEVLANAVGPEPDQEWIELYNDGTAAADLSDYRIVDIGGETPLPSLLLPAKSYVVVVNEGYDSSGEYDPAPAASALVIEVPSLGKNGLSNSGEPLKLMVGEQVASRFPAEPKPNKAGHSVLRLTPNTADADPNGFVLAPDPSPGW